MQGSQRADRRAVVWGLLLVTACCLPLALLYMSIYGPLAVVYWVVMPIWFGAHELAGGHWDDAILFLWITLPVVVFVPLAVWKPRRPYRVFAYSSLGMYWLWSLIIMGIPV